MKLSPDLQLLVDCLDESDLVRFLCMLHNSDRVGVLTDGEELSLGRLPERAGGRMACVDRCGYVEITLHDGDTTVFPALDGMAVDLSGNETEVSYTEDALLLTLDGQTEACGDIEEVLEALAYDKRGLL